MRDLLDKIPQSRGKLESTIRKFKGAPVYIIELKVFGTACGCIGMLADVRGLQIEDIEVYQEHFVAILSEISRYIGLKPDLMYARTLPGSFEVVAFTARELCSRCKNDLASFEKPRPDLIILNKA
ncbi:hypothetical protein ANME2D_01097 [Candidatus Methanoperedens nitroreducens]|uniref:Uncharacterized protein n=1 Tax=Candidatus Methanoperedens nitratireducens TaxID=1392998 RepID=A0A062V0J3_9EURY|nr:DUF5402 family protein [Candidatus Methanoperedens nitroreducens]KCZ72666.1 hypothetical protein ANME2D_01097 [Candidatus Methanoperedens nitroreducens]MDJ1423402.1 DUF5402 family protein [Candidatus Methanoperedens sp.]